MIAITINTQAIRVEKWLLNFWNIGFSKSRHPLLASLPGVLSASGQRPWFAGRGPVASRAA